MDIPKLPMEKLKRIHLIPYTHTDFAWTNTRQWHVWRYLKCFSVLLDIMREDEDLTWNIDNVLHSLKAFEVYCPERMEEFIARVREGRIQIAGGGMALARPNYVGEETWIRNAVEGKRYMARLFGIPMEEMTYFFNADTGIGHSQMPQLLRQMGYDSYRSMRPEATLNFKGIPRNFNWKGPDGSCVTVSRGEYGGFLYCDWMRDENTWEQKREGFIREDLDKLRNRADEEVMMLYDGCDDVQPLRNLFDEEIPLREFMAEWNAHEDSRIFFSTPQAFFADLRENCDLKTVEGPLDQADLAFNPPIKGENSFWRLRKKLDQMLTRLETVNLIGVRLGLEDDSRKIDELWNDLFEIAGHAIEFVIKQDHDELFTVASSACLQAQRMLRDKLRAIARCVACSNGPCYAVVNPLGWPRKAAPVRLHICGDTGIRAFDLVDGSGKNVPYQIVDIYTGDKNYGNCEHNGVDVIAYPDVPALGVNPLRVIEREVDDLKQRYTLADMDSMPLQWGRCGEVVWSEGDFVLVFRDGFPVSAGGVSAFRSLTFHACRPSPDWVPGFDETAAYTFLPEEWAVRRSGPTLYEYVSRGHIGPHRAQLTCTWQKGTRELHMAILLNAEVGEGYFTADFAADSDTPIRVDIPYGAEDRELSGEPGFAFVPDGTPVSDYYAANFFFEQGWKGQFYGKNWVRYRLEGKPVTLMNTDCSIYYQFAPEDRRISMMLNRQHEIAAKSDERALRWVKQASPAIEGTGVCEYHLTLSLEEADDAAAARRVRELHKPLLAEPRWGFAGGTLEAPCGLIGEWPGQLVVTAAYSSAGRVCVRMYEAAGSRFDCLLPVNVASARLTDLLGNVTEELPVEQGGVRLRVQPWKIYTLEMEMREE